MNQARGGGKIRDKQLLFEKNFFVQTISSIELEVLVVDPSGEDVPDRD